MKKGPLSNKEKEYITEHLSEGAEKLAKEMNRSESIVQKFVDNLPSDTEEKSDVSGLFARNEERGVTVMTETASMAADENKSKETKTPSSPDRYRKYIHKIKE
jgi:hypothetical protein